MLNFVMNFLKITDRISKTNINSIQILWSSPGGHSIVKNTGGLARLFGVWDFGWERYFGVLQKY